VPLDNSLVGLEASADCTLPQYTARFKFRLKSVKTRNCVTQTVGDLTPSPMFSRMSAVVFSPSGCRFTLPLTNAD
jgi:hypothetical protein